MCVWCVRDNDVFRSMSSRVWLRRMLLPVAYACIDVGRTSVRISIHRKRAYVCVHSGTNAAGASGRCRRQKEREHTVRSLGARNIISFDSELLLAWAGKFRAELKVIGRHPCSDTAGRTDTVGHVRIFKQSKADCQGLQSLQHMFVDDATAPTHEHTVPLRHNIYMDEVHRF